MKQIVYIILLWLCTSFTLHAQQVMYSRQTFSPPYYDALQMVTNIAGYTHLVAITGKEKPEIIVYDDKLQLVGRKLVNVKISLDTDVQITRFQQFYYLYVHHVGSIKHQLWKIDRNGNSTDVSVTLQQLVEEEGNIVAATMQLINKDNQLHVLSHTYFDEIKKIRTTAIQVDDELKKVKGYKVLFAFNKAEDVLRQITYAGNHLLILKTIKNEETGNILQLMKVAVQNSMAITRSYNSFSHPYLKPTLSYNNDDSSILIHALLQRSVFITRLNHQLVEQIPVVLLKSQFKNNIETSFIYLKGITNQWIEANLLRQNNINGRNLLSSEQFIPVITENYNYGNELWPAALQANARGNATNSTRHGRHFPSVRFTMVNEIANVNKDSVVDNSKDAYTLNYNEFAIAKLKHKSYLFLAQTFGTNRRGLLMVAENEQAEITATDIRVHIKNDYLLMQAQAVDNQYLIMPYLHKKELGLVKIML